ncbi:MAG: undecaprenyl-diphosphate phosphatase [Deltaproteobacteria bacterium]|nr:undecaprenyl-diphosphate phosphatase [Deltaproteobacteria bacterium]MBW2074296.1 undecaprenyl-diphosphate phosphatase [Deltaproteobacteria bacterium]RLB82882.1 MAG: UDP-diphosphatase [Deltaproteobacteria bacterium]
MDIGMGYAAVLGIIQGLTEFLPVSSSGHLVLFQNLLGLTEPEIFFDVSLHVGTLIALCVFFFEDLKGIATTLFSVSTWSGQEDTLWKRLRQKPEMRLLGLILLGTVPTAFLGLVFRPMAEKLFSSVQIVGSMLLVTGLLLWLTRGLKREGRHVGQLMIWDALLIGTIQGLAILPGISRSGATIAMGLFRGLSRETAVRYSFLLSIPAILGAMLLELGGALTSGFPPAGVVLLGTFMAAAVGFAALKILIHLVKKGNLYAFAPYCWLLGILAIVGSF